MADSAAVDDDGQWRLSRRALLAGGGLLALASACRHTVTRPRVAGPDDPAVAAARQTELELISAYDAAGAGTGADRFAMLCRDAHVRHLVALGGSAPPAPGSTPSSVPDAAAVTRAHERETASAAGLRSAAVAERSGESAALLASIAASHAAMGAFRQVGAGP